jgi:ketosteroid isomerase-like protein
VPNSQAPVSWWVNAFNLRDLEGMLACMSDDVRFYPLRLDGLERYYRGHDGVRTWFGQLDRLGHSYRIDLRNLREEPDGEVVAIGELLLEGASEPTRFWARDQVEDGLIVVAHHYLTDPDIFDDIDASQRWPSRPSRFPNL